ncbi:MAG: hypothetical protein K9H16_12015, partial [Bacteroidales bacterium]|nr:hypothetical protein [Bacteroidales bacterium]
NSWIPAFKGIFFFIFGLFAFLQTGTFDTLSIFFDVLIILIAILHLSLGLFVKDIKNRIWIIVVGFFHLAFGIWLSINYGGERLELLWIVIGWILFSALTDLVEAIMLYINKNVLGTLFVINTIITLIFAYFTLVMIEQYTPRVLSYLGIIAIMVGLVTECTAFIFSKSKYLPE